MPRITVSGTLPGVIVENTTAAGWVGSLALSGDLASLTSTQLAGTGASYFSASIDALHGLVLISPAARIDYEAFRALNLTPALDFTLNFTFSDGTQQAGATTYHVSVLNLDDTPPSALAFSTGGTLAAGDIGSIIGTLRVTDVETTGPFTFSFADADSWRFEVVGNTLKLKDGISLGLDDIGTFNLPILVSDGVQSAGFTLHLNVTAPGAQPDLIDFLLPGEFAASCWYDDATSMSSMHASAELSYVENYGQGVRALMFRDGSAVWLPDYVQELHFTDGWVDLRHNGSAASVLALYHTILHRNPDPQGYADLVKLVEGGMSLPALTAAMLQSPEYLARIGNPDNTTFVTDLYRDALGRAPDSAGLAFHLARLQTGTSRTQLVDDFAFSPESLNAIAAQHPDGFWVTNPHGQYVAMVYAVGLGRGVEPAGLDYWTSQLASGALSLTRLAGVIGGSQEFLGGYALLTDADFVTAMYHNALHRDPDPTGFADWTSRLANHSIARSDMVYGFAFSQENMANFSLQPGGLDLFHA